MANSASTARRDRILKLTTGPKYINSPPAALKIDNKQKPTATTETATTTATLLAANNKTKPNATVTNIKELYSRPFEWGPYHPREYETSYNFVQTYDIDSLRINEFDQSFEDFLCHEIFDETIDVFHDSDNDKDSDYIPDVNQTSSDDENIEQNYKNERKMSKLITHEVQKILNKENETELQETSNEKIKTINLETQNQKTEVEQRKSPSLINVIEIETNNEESQIQHFEIEIEEETRNESFVIENRETLNDDITIEDQMIQINDIEATENEITKSGNPRKRRKFRESLKERQKVKKQKKIEQLNLKNPCKITCRLKCTTKITEIERKAINNSYINLNYEAEGLFVKCQVDKKEVANRANTGNVKPRRNVSYSYFFTSNTERTEVCKPFFLSTLGYKPTNDTRVMGILNKPIDCQQTKRGRHERENKIDKEVVKKHIMTYNPCVSHYRREHAPKKLYLPSDLTITFMHSQFSQFNVSLEYYRKVVTQDMNISFAQLGHEECEQCAYFDLHDLSHKETPDSFCDTCKNYVAHKSRYTQTRTEYQNDVDASKTTSDSIYYSADLQKVVMLPQMDQFKLAIFCPRIIVFNESFVPLGKSILNIPFAVVWNETISGKKQEDLISTFRAFFIFYRDVKHIVLWLDNCAAQNKNWAFMSFLVNIINSNLIGTDSITIKYFEPGHSFMSADSFHHQVELSMKAKSKVYDFQDFVSCVQMANSKKNTVKVMEISDFYNYRDLSSQHKLRKNEDRVYLKNVMAMKVDRGSFVLQVKRTHDVEFELSIDFLQTKISKSLSFPETSQKCTARGITVERKQEIISKLVPLMPNNRRAFWFDIPISNSPTQNDLND